MAVNREDDRSMTDTAETIALRQEVESLREALTKCRELFSEIRMDWSDPRAECREGWAIIDAALQPAHMKGEVG